ncbi:MAG: extracellular solute-binding protein [Lachnospiraceae bacterium]|nr:extracellular solute-binding protein [Lachnospiraceae bacterium]
MKKITALLLSLGMVMSLVGCGGTASEKQDAGSQPAESEAQAEQQPSEASEPVELTFYYPTQVGGDLANGMEAMIEDFNETHENIIVTPVYTGSYKNTAQTAMTDISGGNAPNVILSGMLDIVDYYNIGKVQNLNDLIAAEGDEWKADFIDGFWGNFVYPDGGTYGLPYQHSICTLYVNMDKLKAAGVEKAPETWEEYLDACEKLQAADAGTITIEFPSDVWVLEALTLSDGGKLCASNTETLFDSDEAVESLGMMQKLINAGGMIQTYATAAEDFVAESCAMMLNTTGNLGLVMDTAEFDWQISMVPVKEAPGLSYGGGGLIMIADQTPEEEAASWEFMKWMTEPEQSARWMDISGYFCVRKSCADLDDVKAYYAENPQTEQASELLQYTTAQWTTDSYWDVYACMQTALDSVLIDNQDPAACLAQAQTDAMAILQP